MLIRPHCAFLISLTIGMAAASSLSAQVSTDEGQRQELILGLPNVTDVTFDDSGRMLHFSTEDTIFRYAIEPFALLNSVKIDGRISSITLDRNGDLIYQASRNIPVGDREVAADVVQRLLPEFKLPEEISADSYIAVKNSPMRSIAAAEDGGVLFAQVRSKSFSRVVLSRTGPAQVGQILSVCGLADRLESLQISDQSFYVASMLNQPTVQVGPFSPEPVDLAKQAGCYELGGNFYAVQNNQSGAGRNVFLDRSTIGFHLVKDPELVDYGLDDATANALIVVDTEEQTLRFFPLDYYDGELSLLYSKGERFELEPIRSLTKDDANLISAASGDGQTILVARRGDTRLLRIRREKSEFTSFGMFDFAQPIKLVRLSHDGQKAAVVTQGDRLIDDSDAIRLILNLHEIQAGEELNSAALSVRELQELLKPGEEDRDYNDGQFGRRTLQALVEFSAAEAGVRTETSLGKTRGLTITADPEQVPVLPIPQDDQKRIRSIVNSIMPTRAQEMFR